ncbi:MULTISPECIES: hypothetical protein [Neptunomonas]|uniref:Uncharacterized protein n=1 Tax=Neptunomonas marina TaxID=1815562 RepID=A0A437QDP9_9GAMM|nr:MULTISPECIES: hypothetical protein [Neptunomonas]RVU32682.1 hypothetical protein EOE65_03240 [Neptunomonas marina]
MDYITLEEIALVLISGGSYRTGPGTWDVIDFSDVEEKITEMDGENGACDAMLYGELKQIAAEQVAADTIERIAAWNDCIVEDAA